MIHFTKNEDNEQFVGIRIHDKSSTSEVLSYILKKYPLISNQIFDMDAEEIIINTPAEGEHYNFSLNDLRRTVSNIADAEITMFCININSDTQMAEMELLIP